MPHSFHIDIVALRAVACAASGEETRYYLKGVFVEFGPDGILMTATDGAKLIHLRQPYQDDTGANVDLTPAAPLPGVIIPSDLIAKLKIRIKTLTLAKLTIDGLKLTFEYCGDVIGGTAIDGTYPNYRAVMPRDVSGESAQFDAAQLAAFTKARGELGLKKGVAGRFPVWHNGGNPALVDFAHGTGFTAIGVLMPVRSKAELAPAMSLAALAASPLWFRETGASATEAAA